MADLISYKNFSETDFELIKDSLKSFLRNQDEFKDFNFDGAAINVLLNLLAYNTQYNAYYVNMLASESFITHAQKRESVVGLANNLGYVPRSVRPASSILSFKVIPDSGYTSPIQIPKDTKFTTEIDGKSYQFLTTISTVANIQSNGTYVFNNIEVKQGRKFTHRFTIDGVSKFYTLPNKGVDTSRITVYIKPNVNSTTSVEYTLYDTITTLDSTSRVFFIQETYNELFEIYFGDGILGSQPEIGNQIVVEYYISDGAEANNAKVFSLDDEVTGLDVVEFTSIEPSVGGSNIESIDSVRLSAASNYVSQNRAVSSDDYISIIRKLYPDIVDISVWGGEDATPKQYGKVFISMLRENNQFITEYMKTDILNKIKASYSIVALSIEIVDPVRIYLKTNIKAYYDATTLDTTSLGQLKMDVLNAVKSYASTELSKFNAQFFESRVVSVIDNSSQHIQSNHITTQMYVKLTDIINYKNPNTITFNQAISTGSVVSTEFTFSGNSQCIFKDNSGLLSVYAFDPISGYYNILIQNSVGTVNYSTGTITYTSVDTTIMNIFENATKEVYISASPLDNDVVGKNDNIVILNESDIAVELVNGRT